ncbi:SUMO1 sentrin specific peptidase 8 [Homalodisca vitripennis]|nr:SUMO1 sentrin specific peptidase 8 [Homalodisca vitripennis]
MTSGTKGCVNPISQQSPIKTPVNLVLENSPVSCNTQTNTDGKITMSLSILENDWITDETIQLYYDSLAVSVLRSNNKIFLMNTVVTQAIKCLEDFDHLLKPLHLSEKTLIFFPIYDLQQKVDKLDPEDTKNLYKQNGSHWSLLVFVRSIEKFLYFDSSGTYNIKHAQEIANKVQNYVGTVRTIPFHIVSVPQQPNSVDCGVYLTLFTDIILQLESRGVLDTLGSASSRLPCAIDRSDVFTKRAQLAFLWHNYQHLQYDSQTISDMMFKFIQLQHKVDSTMDIHNNVTAYHPEHKNHPTRCEKWKTIENTRDTNSCFTNEYFNIITSNSFSVLQEEEGQRANDSLKENHTIKNHTINKQLVKSRFTLNHCVKEQIKAELYADSQGRDLPEIVGRCSRGKIYMDGLVKPGADIQYVYDQASKSLNKPLVLIAGTNDISSKSSNVIYKNIESRLVELSKSRPVCITTIPPRFDKEQNDTIHYNLALANRHIKDLVSKLENVELIDLDTFKRNHFSRQGMHLNYSGKRKLAFMISDFLLNITSENQKTIQEANNDGLKKKNCLENRLITIIDMNMADVIRHFRYKKNVGFAHSISGDFYHPRHMSAGVAAVFGRLFGRPETSQCLTDHLAVQDKTNCASVFSLITKSRYFGKPAKHDYDIAFGDLAHNFKKRRLNHLICSPIGCVRDKIELTHFIDNLLKFQQKTKAKITIVSYFQKSHRVLRNELSHDEFLKQIENIINIKCSFLKPSQKFNNTSLEAVNPTTAQAEMMTSRISTPTAAANEISHATTQCEQVKVVPGVFTFSEMLKQSNTISAESANTSPVCAISEILANNINPSGDPVVTDEDYRQNSCFTLHTVTEEHI